MEIYFSKGIKWLGIHFDPASEVRTGLMAFPGDPFPFWGWCWGRKKFTVCAQPIFHRGSLAPFPESHVPGRASANPLCFHPKLLMQPATADHLCSCSWRNSNRAVLLSANSKQMPPIRTNIKPSWNWEGKDIHTLFMCVKKLYIKSPTSGSFPCIISSKTNVASKQSRHMGLLTIKPCILKWLWCKLIQSAVGLPQNKSLGLVRLSATAPFPSIYLHSHQSWWVGLLSNLQSTNLTVWFEVPHTRVIQEHWIDAFAIGYSNLDSSEWMTAPKKYILFWHYRFVAF